MQQRIKSQVVSDVALEGEEMQPLANNLDHVHGLWRCRIALKVWTMTTSHSQGHRLLSHNCFLSVLVLIALGIFTVIDILQEPEVKGFGKSAGKLSQYHEQPPPNDVTMLRT